MTLTGEGWVDDTNRGSLEGNPVHLTVYAPQTPTYIVP